MYKDKERELGNISAKLTHGDSEQTHGIMAVWWTDQGQFVTLSPAVFS